MAASSERQPVRSGSSYTLKVTDSTHPANSFTTTQACSGCAKVAYSLAPAT